jgi:hypothetical protein
MNAFLNTTFGKTTPTRYEVYAWEMFQAATRLQSQGGPNGTTAYSTPVCAASGVTPSANAVDRRVLSAAVVNCVAQGVGGRTTNVQVTKWIDIFLVEPSTNRTRTENSDVYIEVIRITDNANDDGAVQLVKKSVPYLVE